jgi:hypothetical protein
MPESIVKIKEMSSKSVKGKKPPKSKEDTLGSKVSPFWLAPAQKKGAKFMGRSMGQVGKSTDVLSKETGSNSLEVSGLKDGEAFF